MIKLLWRYVRTSLTAVLGDPDKRKAHRDLVRRLPRLSHGLSEFGATADLAQGTAPVFAFAPTWRCGSTLVQRLVMSTDEIWMWGEVYTQAEPLQQMVGMFRPFREDFPDSGLFRDPALDAVDLSDDWIARLSPEPRYLVEAHREFWERLCARPARDRGYDRWGLKAVNLPVDYAVYLKRLYRDARFVFLVRNPWEAWLSYRRFRNWYGTFPDDPVFTVQRFARMWAEHTEQFLGFAEREEDSLFVRFEDLIRGGGTTARLSEHLDSEVDASVLDRKVSGTDTERARSTTFVERYVLRSIVGDQAERLGYEPV